MEPLAFSLKEPEKIVRNGAAKTPRASRQSRTRSAQAGPGRSLQPRAVSKRAGVVRCFPADLPAGEAVTGVRTGSMAGALISRLPSCGGS
ncbi:hypothetical protein SPURM210S_01917 [Streptomyces purpurascens]